MCFDKILSELGIPQLANKKTQKCNYKTMNIQKFKNNGIKLKNLLGLNGMLDYLIILRFYKGLWNVLILPRNSTNAKIGGIYKGF